MAHRGETPAICGRDNDRSNIEAKTPCIITIFYINHTIILKTTQYISMFYISRDAWRKTPYEQLHQNRFLQRLWSEMDMEDDESSGGS